jgi:hypothetical protein
MKFLINFFMKLKSFQNDCQLKIKCIYFFLFWIKSVYLNADLIEQTLQVQKPIC